MDDRVVKFARTPEGLYAYKPSDRYLAEVAESKCMNPPDSTDAVTAYRGRSFLISSVEENRKGYTQRQFDDAKRARRFYHIMGCPTIENLKQL
ncbi:MAG: hypothetical protein ACP5NO_08285, partial [Thermoplasmata archaeon]